MLILWMLAGCGEPSSATIEWPDACEGIEDGGTDSLTEAVTIENDFDGLLCVSPDAFSDREEVSAYLKMDGDECIPQGGAYTVEVRLGTSCPAPGGATIEVWGTYCVSLVSCEEPEVVQTYDIKM